MSILFVKNNNRKKTMQFHFNTSLIVENKNR